MGDITFKRPRTKQSWIVDCIVTDGIDPHYAATLINKYTVYTHETIK